MQHKTLCIDITLNCNFRCPWCIQDSLVKKIGRNGYLSEEAENKLREHIITTPHSFYAFHGGECTLYPTQMLELMDFIRKNNPNASLKLFTNGSLLNDDLVNELNKRYVHVCLGVNGSGYKSVQHMLQKTNNKNLLQTIDRIKIFNIRNVFTYELDDFAVDILNLRKYFKRTHIELNPDYTSLEKWDNNTLIKYENILNNYEKMDMLKNTSMMGCFCRVCDCPHENLHFYTDGVFGRNRKYHANYAVSGCAMLHKLMGEDIYSKFVKISQKYWRLNENEQFN